MARHSFTRKAAAIGLTASLALGGCATPRPKPVVKQVQTTKAAKAYAAKQESRTIANEFLKMAEHAEMIEKQPNALKKNAHKHYANAGKHFFEAGNYAEASVAYLEAFRLTEKEQRTPAMEIGLEKSLKACTRNEKDLISVYRIITTGLLYHAMDKHLAIILTYRVIPRFKSALKEYKEPHIKKYILSLIEHFKGYCREYL